MLFSYYPSTKETGWKLNCFQVKLRRSKNNVSDTKHFQLLNRKWDFFAS